MSSFSFPTYAFPLLYLSSMDKVTVHYDGKAYEVTKGTSLMDFLSMKEKLSYDDDPFVGALINGEYKSLHYSFNYSYTTIEPIRLFSGLGKRIYRHSICFLLSYAASRLFPDHHLEIGHSLGDGFYFHFTDMDVREDDIQALADLMKRTVEDNLPILKEKIPYTEALRIFSGNHFSHTAELLGSRNDGDITIYTLNGYMDSAYEPIVPRTGVLSKWHLMKYEDGMLLRYPQSRDVMNIKSFVDNPLLYSVFKRSRREGEVLGCEALGQLNGLILAGKANELIQMSENMFNDRIFEVANDIRSRGRVKFIFISGPPPGEDLAGQLLFHKRARARGQRWQQGLRDAGGAGPGVLQTEPGRPAEEREDDPSPFLLPREQKAHGRRGDGHGRRHGVHRRRDPWTQSRACSGHRPDHHVQDLHLGSHQHDHRRPQQDKHDGLQNDPPCGARLPHPRRRAGRDVQHVAVDRARREEPHLPVPEQCGRHDKQRLALRDVGIDTAGVEPAQVGQARDGTGIRDGKFLRIPSRGSSSEVRCSGRSSGALG